MALIALINLTVAKRLHDSIKDPTLLMIKLLSFHGRAGVMVKVLFLIRLDMVN